jgi:hypothetical protein
MSAMLPSEVYNLLRLPAAPSAEASLRKAWLASQSKPCKDVVALAMPLRKVPTTLEAFRHALAENSKGGDWLLSSWYVVHVGAADGREWGWSNAPYDTKKRLPDTKPLYSTDSDGPQAGQTRFWSFKKVSNNMNKGARVEDGDGEDLSFVLPPGTSFSHFLREDSYGDKPLFCVGEEQHELAAYAPVLLQLSSTNSEQAAKGNGLKLRRVLPVPASVLGAFCDKFYARKEELDEAQQRAAGCKALSSTAKPVAGCPLACKVDRNAFWFHDEAAQVVEILDSGVDPELGGKLLVPAEMLLRTLHSADLRRSLNMLTVALGHGAVTCVVAASKEDAPGVCRVVHLHVDVAEALWLGTLQKSRNADCPELPVTSVLTMCFGQALADSARPAGESLRHLQWYSPSCKVPLATEDGHEVSRHVVFEMELSAKSVDGQRELAQKTFLMDGVAGAHYTVKMFLAGSVQFQPHAGLACENLEPLLSWQLRPGLGAEAGSALQTTRKRQFVQADATDNELLAVEPGGAPAAKSVRFDSLVAVRVDSVVSDSAESI